MAGGERHTHDEEIEQCAQKDRYTTVAEDACQEEVLNMASCQFWHTVTKDNTYEESHRQSEQHQDQQELEKVDRMRGKTRHPIRAIGTTVNTSQIWR